MERTQSAQAADDSKVPFPKIGLFYISTLLVGAMLPLSLPSFDRIISLVRQSDQSIIVFGAAICCLSSISLLMSIMRKGHKIVSFRLRDL